ncbi:MAG TPA: HDOD domain-containing protein [Gammaproteobacteria bacterium]|nr:HDOD domain-containing protein [Gammaproteobacteria bacterium]
MSSASAVKSVPIATLITDACAKLLSNQTSLPSMPAVAARIHDAMASSNWSMRTIAAIIKSDVGTTTYLLHVANSPLYAGATPVRQVEQAIARLGINSTRHLVMAHAVRSTFVTRSPLLTSLMQRTWASSTRLAALCGVLAKHCSSFRPESATLAGLLQDIGVLPILNVLNRYQDQLSSEAPVLSAIDKFAPPVGTILLSRWGFEADMVEVARSRGNWLRHPQPAADLADLVLVARLHANITSGNREHSPRIDAVPAFAKLPLGSLEPDGSIALLHDEEATIDELMGSLAA